MTREDLDKQKFAASYVLEIVNNFGQRIDENQKIIDNKRLTHEGAKLFSLEITKALNGILLEAKTSQGDPASVLEKVLVVIGSISDSIERATKQGTEELIRMESTQEGMKRALDAVKTSALGTLNDVSKIEKMAEAPPPEEKTPRVPGTRPEKVALKRQAADIRAKEAKDLEGEK